MVYVAGGVTCAVLDIGLMQVLIAQGTNHVMAASAGFILGLVVNYAFHARLTFNAATSLASISRFLSVVVINYLLTIAFVSLSFSLFENALIGKIASLPMIAINGFLLSKYWVFKS